LINIAVMGYGVVGSGVVEVFYKNHDSIIKKASSDMDIKYILDLRDFNDSPYASKFTKSFEDIISDDSVKVVVEVMGGIDPAYDYVKRCLLSGKSVVTSNKELVAAKGAELLNIAMQKDVNFLFEASVGGGIPIIRPLHQCLAANEIDEIEGILNGTTNFILTKMIREKMEFEAALKLAQQLGYAERNPAADIEGHDACRKICILASLAYGKHVYPQNVHTEGIANITPEDVEYASDWDGAIKLIGKAKRLENSDKVFAMVSPCFVSHESQLSTVDDVFNGILVRGDATGDVVFYGKGAGKLPTASAVVGDVIDAVKHNGKIKSLYWEDSTGNNVADYKAMETAMYVRCISDNNAVSAAQSLFGSVRELKRSNQPQNEYAFVTPVLKERQIDEMLDKMSADGVKVLAKIRVL